MTEEIDLDELDVVTDDDPDANPGDWFWRDEGDPAEQLPFEPNTPAGETGTDGQVNAEQTDDPASGAESHEGGETTRDRVPHVPRENKDSPVGIPVDGGGAGVQSAGEAAEEPPDHSSETAESDAAAGDAGEGEGEGGGETGDREASGPHGGDIDEMTMALTYGAMKRLEDPKQVVADANAWADWVGIVGDVPAFVINKFQRENRIDVDFFNGSSQGPAERLADVDDTSMFYAERMVLVGLDDESWMGDPPEWEFVPLSEAAEKADWAWSDENGTDA